jgi:hypothetical protein
LGTGLNARPHPDTAPKLAASAMLPKGVRYWAVVPDTLDLAERARLSVRGLTAFLDPKANYAPYGHFYFNANPAFLTDLPGGPPNWGKITESLVFTRAMCGSREGLEIQAKSFRGMISPPTLLPDRTYAFSPDYMRVNPSAPTPLSRSMLALIALYQVAPDPALRALIDQQARGHATSPKRIQDMLYYYDAPPDQNAGDSGEIMYGTQEFVAGCAIRALARWYDLVGTRAYLDAAGGLARFAMLPKFWTPEAEPKVVAGSDRAEFDGHFHSYTQCLMGLLVYAEAAHDRQMEEFVRSGYEWARSFGLARIGLFGEACGTGDMTYLALKLSLLGVGDFWDDADQYVRNELAELQISDGAKLQRVVDGMPPGHGVGPHNPAGPFDPQNESTDDVVRRCVGAFFSDSTHPTRIPQHSLLATICCTGNCTPALYFAWDSIVRCADGNAQINLLLNRASPWLDVDSYLPYEGKVAIHDKTARRISVRLPYWVDRTALRCTVNGRRRDPLWAGRYAVLETLPPHAEIRLTFPVPATTERYHLAWKQSGFWQESTNPGEGWKPDRDRVFTCTFRGNTLVDIIPRDSGPGYPLYERDTMKAAKAPMHTVERYIAPKLPAW